MYFTNYKNHESPQLFGLSYVPLKIWKFTNYGKYIYRVHYKNFKDIDYIDKKIIDLAKKNKNFYIMLDDSLEGYAYLNFKYVYNFVIKYRLEHKVIYSSGHTHVKNEYANWLAYQNFNSTFYVLHHDIWFWKNRIWSIEKKIKCSSTKKIWYSCLNNRPREHRLAAITYLDYLNILNLGIVSANDKNYEDVNSPYNFKTILDSVLSKFQKNYSIVLQNQQLLTEKKLPLIADVKDLANKCLPHDLSPTVYSNTLINLVTETFYFDSWNSFSEMFITEKTWKVFTAKQIPIIIGPRGIVQKLKNYGFDMFEDIIDHSYDNEPDSTRLFSAINSLKNTMESYDVESLSKLTKQRRISNLNKMLKEMPLNPPTWSFLQ
jgi:hypothetical protein